MFMRTAEAGVLGSFTEVGTRLTGYGQSASSYRAPIFYDSDDTGFYADFNSLSRLYQLNVDGVHQSGYGIIKVISDNDALISLYTENNATSGMRCQSTSGGTDVLFVGKKGSSDTQFVVDFGFAQASEEFIVDSSGNSYSRASSRAPIFYDLDNTSYYVNPNGASNIGSFTSNSTVNVQTASDSAVYHQIENTSITGTYAYLRLTQADGGNGYLIKNRTTGNSVTNQSLYLWNDPGPIEFVPNGTASIRTTLSTTGAMTIRGPASSQLTLVGTEADLWLTSTGSSATWRILGSTGSTTHRFRIYDETNASERFYINASGNVFAQIDMRAPIFYDSNDTGYYVNPADISSMTGVAIRGDNASTGTANQIFFWSTGNTTTSAIGFKSSGGSFTNPTGAGDGYNTYLTMDTPGRGWVFREGVGGSNFGAAYTSGWILNNGVWQANASMRAPIFYDSNDTAYYVNPNGSTSAILAGTVGIGTTSPSLGSAGSGLNIVNSTYTQLRVQSSGSSAGIEFKPSTGNSWEFQGTNSNTLIVYDRGQNQYRMSIVGNGNVNIGWNNDSDQGYKLSVNGTGYAVNDFRAPIFYDSDNTGYYLNPNSTSNIVNLTLAGALRLSSSGYLTDNNIFESLLYASFPNGTSNLAADIRFGNNSFWGYIEVEITGTYANQNTPGKLTKLFAVGTNPGNNIYANVSRVADLMGPIVDNIAIGDFSWDASNSTYRIPISHIVATGNDYTIKVRMFTHGGGANAPYAALTLSSNYTLTALAAHSAVSYNGNLLTGGSLLVGGAYANNPYNSVGSTRLYFGGSNDTNAYFIGTNTENYGGSYTKLDLRWHTGIRMGARPNYGGIRFYDNEALDTQIFAIGKDGSYAQANQSMRAPIFYDLDNTSYYLDPASTSNVNAVNFNGILAWSDGAYALGSPSYGFRFNNTANSINAFIIDNSGNSYSYTSSRAPIFYDSGNTGYYFDGASTSVLNAVTVDGNFAVGVSSGSTSNGARMELRGNGVWNAGFNFTNTGTSGRTWTLFSTNTSFGQGAGKFLLYNATGGSDGFSVDSSNNLVVGGNITAYGTVSDKRLKHSINELPSMLQKILALKPVSYSWNEDSDQYKTAGLRDDIGFIAQDVQEVEPLLVREGADGLLGLRERGIIAMLTKAFQEQNKEVVDLRAKVERLEHLISKLIDV